MEQEQIILMKMFPHLIVSENFTRYEGFMVVEGFNFQISVCVPEYPSLDNLSLRGSPILNSFFKHDNSLMNQLILNESLHTFLEKLKMFLILQMKKIQEFRVDYILAENFTLLLSALENIGFDNVLLISSCFTEIQLKTTDAAMREHILYVNVGKTYPNGPMKIEAELPDNSLEIIRKNTVIEGIYKSFTQQVSHLQYVWNKLDVIDSCCCVLEPEHPAKRDIDRRILIDKNVSIYLSFNIENLQAMPKIMVLGPENSVQHFQSALARNAEEWDLDGCILENLKNVLELSSLPKKIRDSEDTSLFHQGECLICLNLVLEGELPSVVCDHSPCEGVFHPTCLFQWLQAVPGNYQSFNRMYGACPNCNTPISCPISKFS